MKKVIVAVILTLVTTIATAETRIGGIYVTGDSQLGSVFLQEEIATFMLDSDNMLGSIVYVEKYVFLEPKQDLPVEDVEPWKDPCKENPEEYIYLSGICVPKKH